MALPSGEEAELLAYSRLRRDVGASEDTLTNTIAAEYFTEADEKYPNDTAKMTAYTRVIAIRGIRASAAMLGKYAQNQSQEDLTKVFDNLGKMLVEWQAEVAIAADPVEAGASAFFFTTAPGQRGR